MWIPRGGMDAVIIDEAPVMPQTKGLAGSVINKQTGQEFIGKRIGHFADQSFFGVGLTSVFGTFSEQDEAKSKDVLSFREGATIRAGGLGWWWHTDKDTLDKVGRGEPCARHEDLHGGDLAASLAAGAAL